MRNFLLKTFRSLGRGLRTGFVAIGALAFLGTVIAVADYAMTQGAGTNFASKVISNVHYAAIVVCDATLGEAQCQAVHSDGSAQVDTPASGNLYDAITAPVPYLNATAWNTNTYSNGATNPGNADLHGAAWIDIGAIGGSAPAQSNPLYVALSNGSNYANAANFVSGSSGNVANTAQTTIITAPVAGKLYVTNIQCFNSGTTTSTITLNDGSTWVGLNAAGGGLSIIFSTPLIVTTTTALKFTPGSSSTNQFCSAQGYNAS